MTDHQIPSCEHGYTNRCRICGIERERVLIPPPEPGGQHSWGIKWSPIDVNRSVYIRDRYDGLNFKPPDGVRKEAELGLKWRKEYNRGGTLVGVARARDLSNGVSVSPETIGRMVSYFARHEVDKEGEGWSPGQDGYPSAGRIAWALWGGDSGKTWAQKVSDQMDSIDEEKKDGN
jgi:hypothetical protein